MTMVTGCVFCEIMAGRAPGDIVHADDLTVAFIDPRQRVYPSAPVDADPATRTSYAERMRLVLAGNQALWK